MYRFEYYKTNTRGGVRFTYQIANIKQNGDRKVELICAERALRKPTLQLNALQKAFGTDFPIIEIDPKLGKKNQSSTKVIEKKAKAASLTEVKVKRGRGRPRKVMIQEETDGTVVVKKRGRGRPRKAPVEVVLEFDQPTS